MRRSADEEAVEALIDALDDVTIVDGRVLPAAVAGRSCERPMIVRSIGRPERRPPIRHIRHALADGSGARLADKVRILLDARIDISDAAEQFEAFDEDVVLLAGNLDAGVPDRIDIGKERSGDAIEQVGLRDERLIDVLIKDREPDLAVRRLALDGELFAERILGL